MKKRILFMIVVLVSAISTTFAKDHSKEYQKLLKKYDVDIVARDVIGGEDFLNFTWRQNERFYDFMSAVKKEKSSAKETFTRLGDAKLANSAYLASLDYADGYEELKNNLLNDLCANKVAKDVKIYVVYNDNKNAFSTPEGGIYINTGLFCIDSLKYEHLLGICAHEFAHYLLQHCYVSTYDNIKREKKNKVAAAITAGVNAAAAGYAAANGADINWEDVNKTTQNLAVAAILDAQKHRYKYSREQEIEADILAARFLDCIEVGSKYYIEALELVSQGDIQRVEEDTDDHPSTSFRIGLLKYMLEHPELNSTKSKELDWN